MFRGDNQNFKNGVYRVLPTELPFIPLSTRAISRFTINKRPRKYTHSQSSQTQTYTHTQIYIPRIYVRACASTRVYTQSMIFDV